MKRRLTLLVGPGRKETSRGEVAVVTVVASLSQDLCVPHSLTICSKLPQYFSLLLLLTNCEPALPWRHSEVLSLKGKLCFSSILTHNLSLYCKGSSPSEQDFFTILIFPTLLSPCCSAIIQRTRATAFSVLCHCHHYSILEFGVLLRFKTPAHCKQHLHRVWVEWDNFEMNCRSKLTMFSRIHFYDMAKLVCKFTSD